MTDAEFWAWFAVNESRFRHVSSDRDRLLDLLYEQLHQVCPKLFAEVSDERDGLCELIISAGGDPDLFAKAESMVSHAPHIMGWKFTALKPPMGFDFVSDYEGVRFDPKGMWFVRLESKRDPSAVGIRVYIPGLDVRDADRAHRAVWQILETGLGERTFAEAVQRVEVEPLTGHPEPQRLRPLRSLEGYLTQFRERSR